MGLLNYLGGRGSSGYGEGSSRHVESDVGGVTVGGVALEEEKSWEQPDPSVEPGKRESLKFVCNIFL